MDISLFFLYYTLDIENTCGILDLWKNDAYTSWNLSTDFTLYLMTVLINSSQSCSFFLVKSIQMESFLMQAFMAQEKERHTFVAILWNFWFLNVFQLLL